MRFRWRYERGVTTAAVLGVGLLSSLVARALLPASWRPASLAWLVPAALVSYAVMRVDAKVYWSKRFKHAVIDRLGGDVDDAQTWVVAGLAGAAFLVAVAVVQRATT
jgi:hypothetical protein